MLQYATQVSPEGHIVLPPEYRNRKVVVLMDDAQDKIDAVNGQLLEERQQRIAAERARIMNRTQEERQVAFDDFMTSWDGCLKGVPHMTAKEIRAERLEKKYGQYRKEGNEE
jgi:hypothetical protein